MSDENMSISEFIDDPLRDSEYERARTEALVRESKDVAALRAKVERLREEVDKLKQSFKNSQQPDWGRV